MSHFHSTYKGWTLWTRNLHGWWLASRVGELSLRADTLQGLRDLITHANNIKE